MKNRYVKILEYMKSNGKDFCTCRELFSYQQEYIDSLYTPELKLKLRKVQESYGFSKEEWDRILYRSHSFYFSPTEEMEACNKDIRSTVKKELGQTPPPVIFSYNIFSGNLSTIFRKGHNFFHNMFRLKNKNGIFEYYLR